MGTRARSRRRESRPRPGRPIGLPAAPLPSGVRVSSYLSFLLFVFYFRKNLQKMGFLNMVGVVQGPSNFSLFFKKQNLPKMGFVNMGGGPSNFLFGQK